MKATMEKSVEIKTNSIQGRYRPKFFDYSGYDLSQVDLNSIFYSSDQAERILLEGEYSFSYLREDKIRTIHAYDKGGNLIPFNEFLSRFGINTNSTNLFKCGKYLSRVFRAVKYAEFFRGLDIHVNHNPKYSGAVTDGLSLVSVELAKALGWKDPKPNMSAQFTLFYKGGLVKGNCVLSDQIKHDVVIYGNDNIKTEISFSNGLEYVALEPLKLSNSLRMDIQSLLNLWDMFGGDQYLEWVYSEIERYKEDLFQGRIERWLDNFNEIDEDMFYKENWILRRAIWHKIDYTRFPGLLRSAWSMFRKSILTYGENSKGSPLFRIPVPGGKRGYLRVDVRNHDNDGNFIPTVERDSICLDKFGNIWIHPDDIEEFLEVKGGADLDDNCAVIPLCGEKALLYRNPNQYGEYGIHKIVYEGVEVKWYHNIIGSIPLKKVTKKEDEITPAFLGNTFLNNLQVHKVTKVTPKITYTINNLIRTYTMISNNGASIGVAANGEMIKTSVGINQKEVFAQLQNKFTWNLERIIDSTVKEGVDCSEDLQSVRDLIEYVIDNKISAPKSLISRFPESAREDIVTDDRHPLDELLEAIKYLIEESDIEILGKGTASKKNRIKGKIDNLDIPLVEIGISNLDNPLNDLAISLLKSYNKEIAITLERTGTLDSMEREIQRREGIEKAQVKLLNKLEEYTDDERVLICNAWAYELYKSNRAVHDSILWIRDINNLRGTSGDTIKMLCNIGVAHHIKKNGCYKRFLELRKAETKLNNIRLWNKDKVDVSKYSDVNEMFIEDGIAILGEDILNLGDECNILDGYYEILHLAPTVSKLNKNISLKNSLTVTLETSKSY